MATTRLRAGAVGAGPALFGQGVAIAAVVAVSLATQRFAQLFVDRLAHLPPTLLSLQLRGAVSYVVIGLGVAAVPAALLRYHRPPTDRADLETVVSVAGTAALVGFVGAYWLHGVANLPVVPREPLGAVLAAGLGSVGPAVAVARWRNRDLALATPGREDANATSLAIFAGAVVGTGWLALAFRLWSGTSWGLGFFSARSGLGHYLVPIVVDVTLPAVVLSLGTAVLFFGALWPWIESMTTRASAVAAVTVLVAASDVALGAVRTGDPVSFVGSAAGLGVAVVVLAGVAAGGVRGLAVLADVDVPPGAGAAGGLALVAVGLVAMWGLGLAGLGGASYALAFAVVAAVAVVAFERTRSVWVPAAALVAFEVVTGLLGIISWLYILG